MGALETLQRRKLSVSEFHRMGEAGILGEDDRIELIDGEMVEIAPIGSLHASKVNLLSRTLHLAVGDDATISVQNPIALPPRDQPQPDIVLLRPRTDYYSNSLPCAADILLLVEVADTTLPYDREIKMPLYARHGIAEAWLADLQSESVIVHRQPAHEGYRDVFTATSGAVISPLPLPTVRLEFAVLWRR
jgi:Uma2 family endonuclease